VHLDNSMNGTHHGRGQCKQQAMARLKPGPTRRTGQHDPAEAGPYEENRAT
jgi:hypothetical protein